MSDLSTNRICSYSLIAVCTMALGGCVSTNIGAVVAWDDPPLGTQLEPGVVFEMIFHDLNTGLFSFGTSYLDAGEDNDIVTAHVEFDCGAGGILWSSGAVSGDPSVRVMFGKWWNCSRSDVDGTYLGLKYGYVWNNGRFAWRLDYGVVFLCGYDDDSPIGHTLTCGVFWW